MKLAESQVKVLRSLYSKEQDRILFVCFAELHHKLTCLRCCSLPHQQVPVHEDGAVWTLLITHWIVHFLCHSHSHSGGYFKNGSPNCVCVFVCLFFFFTLKASDSICDPASSRVLASICVPTPLLPKTNTIKCRLNYEPAFCLLILIIDFEINHSVLFGEQCSADRITEENAFMLCNIFII